MYVRAEDLTILRYRAVLARTLQDHGRPLQRFATTYTGMDLVALERGIPESQHAACVAQLFFSLQGGLEIQPSQSGPLTLATFQPQWVREGPPEHLEAATYPDDLAAIAQVTLEILEPSIAPQPFEVAAHTLRSRQYHEIRWGQRRIRSHVLQLYLGMVA